MTMVNGVDYPADPDNSGWVMGWGVFKDSPWHFAGLAPTRGDAITMAADHGDGYKAAYGSHLPGTDDFVVAGATASR